MTKLLSKFLFAFAIVGLASAAQAGPNSSGVKPSISGSVSLTFNTAFDVYQIHVTTAASSLTVSVQDCCITGDKWKQRTYCLQNGNVIDVRGLGRGDITTFTGSTTVYKGGSQPIDCIVEVRYGEGVAIFPAGMTVQFANATSDAINTTTLSTLTTLPSQ